MSKIVADDGKPGVDESAENCLHCALGELVDKWCTAHGGMLAEEMLERVAELLGDVIASGFAENERVAAFLRCASIVRERIATHPMAEPAGHA